MSTDLNASFNEQFMYINTKLKKRFMRKPNISEATNEFIALAIQCEHSEQPAFAGHAYTGAAKCEATAGNLFGEAEHYLSAARQFMKAEKKLRALKFYSPDRENLEASIGCYMQALNKYPENSLIRASILMELSNDLVVLDHKMEALSYCQLALQIVQDSSMKLMCMKNLMYLQISCGQITAAVKTADTICDSNFNIPENILTEVQMTRILLTLAAEESERSASQSLLKLTAGVLGDRDHDDMPFNADLRLKIQSLMLSSAALDLPTLIKVSADLKQYLNTQQKYLLDMINTKPQRKMMNQCL